MTDIIATNITGTEAFNLIHQGQQLKCPICSSIIETVPKNWRIGEALHGIQCPQEQKHFMIHYEDKTAMQTVRAKMKKMSLARKQEI